MLSEIIRDVLWLIQDFRFAQKRKKYINIILDKIKKKIEKN